MSAVKKVHCLETRAVQTDVTQTRDGNSSRTLSDSRLDSSWRFWTREQSLLFVFGHINIKTNVWRLPRAVCRNVHHQHLLLRLVCCRMHDGDVTYMFVLTWWWWNKVMVVSVIRAPDSVHPQNSNLDEPESDLVTDINKSNKICTEKANILRLRLSRLKHSWNMFKGLKSVNLSCIVAADTDHGYHTLRRNKPPAAACFCHLHDSEQPAEVFEIVLFPWYHHLSSWIKSEFIFWCVDL